MFVGFWATSAYFDHFLLTAVFCIAYGVVAEVFIVLVTDVTIVTMWIDNYHNQIISKHLYGGKVNQSINKPTNQQINKPINQLTNQQTNQLIN